MKEMAVIGYDCMEEFIIASSFIPKFMFSIQL